MFLISLSADNTLGRDLPRKGECQMKVLDITKLQEVLKASGIDKKAASAILANAEKEAFERGGFGISANPPKEIDGVMHYFCRYTGKYYPLYEMVLSDGKSKGYSKIGISAWTKVNQSIKRMDTAIVNAYVAMGEGKELPVSIDDLISAREKLKDALNKQETYKTIVDGKVVLDDALFEFVPQNANKKK